MIQNLSPQCTATQAHTPYQIPATTEKKKKKIPYVNLEGIFCNISPHCCTICAYCLQSFAPNIQMRMINIRRVFINDKYSVLIEVNLKFHHTFLMRRAISVESVTSKASRALAARLSASCCMVCSMSVSPITAFPSNMVLEIDKQAEDPLKSTKRWAKKRW